MYTITKNNKAFILTSLRIGADDVTLSDNVRNFENAGNLAYKEANDHLKKYFSKTLRKKAYRKDIPSCEISEETFQKEMDQLKDGEICFFHILYNNNEVDIKD